MDLLELESSIHEVPGVLGCVILAEASGAPSEVQAFTEVGVDRTEVHAAIVAQATRSGVADSLRRILVFELESEALYGGPEAVSRGTKPSGEGASTRVRPGRPVDSSPAARPEPIRDRPTLRRVTMTSSASGSEARVALSGGSGGEEVVGRAAGETTAHGLQVLAEATLQAVHALIERPRFSFLGASITEAVGREAVLVFVSVEGEELMGSALLRAGPLSEATVRATLDAINRRLSHPL